MGAFYGNIVLKGPSQAEVAAALRGRNAAVTEKIGECIVVFDSVVDEQDTDRIQGLSSRLSKDFQCAVLAAIVHDDDVFMYLCYNRGNLVDWYNSAPDYFGTDTEGESSAPAGGDAQVLCSLFAADRVNEVRAILHGNQYTFETQRHGDLVRAMRLPEVIVGTALASLERGEYPDGLSEHEIVWADDPPPKEDLETRLEREFYEKLGSEDASRRCKRPGCTRGSVRFSLLCKRHHFEMIKGHACPFGE